MRISAIQTATAGIGILILMLALSYAGVKAATLASQDLEAPRFANNLPSGGCAPTWHTITTPDVGHATFTGLAAISGDDVWVVGAREVSAAYSANLAEHWNGTTWSVIPVPNVLSATNGLAGIAAISSDDVWAVGESFDYNRAHTLTVHWNGAAWSIVPSPGMDQYHSELNAVSAVAADDVWAVGTYSLQSIGSVTLIEHWNGIQWSIIPNPNVDNALNYLSGVTALASDDVWAVGYYSDSNFVKHTLTMHWNGTEWSIIPSPNVGGDKLENELRSIGAVSPTDIWAVGNHRNESYIAQTLTLHWDGNVWSVVDSPNPGDNHNALSTIAVISEDDVWAAGPLYNTAINGTATLMLHWDGDAWSVADNAAVNIPSIVHDLAAVSTGDIWAVGSDHTYSYPYMERYYAEPSCVPTPTPEPPRCPGEVFTDVCPSDYFYQHVLDLRNLGILSGYNTIPPCESPSHIPCFKPYNWTTRGQIAKVVSLAAGFTEPPGAQHYEDVPPGSTFYDYIWRLSNRAIVQGYPCGFDPQEPCGVSSLPYFRPANIVSRGQLAKIASNAFGFSDPPTKQSFEDVPPGSTFYEFVERLATRFIIGGYPCGEPGEPCDPLNLPYYRPANTISRGQVAKIVNLARLYVELTATPIYTPTNTSSPTNTRTPRPSRTPTYTLTPGTPGSPSPTPTCIPSAKGWTSGQDLPVTLIRAFGAYFPPNGKFYALGGRTGDGDPNMAQVNPLEYDPAANNWMTKSATFPDLNTSNVQGGVLNFKGAPVIALVGGSAGGGAAGTTQTRIYDPINDTLITLDSDPWQPGATTVPGGSAVVDNKLYILGGFIINTGMSDEIWRFDPDAEEGSRWTLLPTALPHELGYIPTTVINDLIYMAGGSAWDGTTLVDTAFAAVYDPYQDTIAVSAGIPRSTAETSAVTVGGKMWVLGGGRNSPNPSGEVNIYDPASDTWSLGPAFLMARRNFPAGTNGAGTIYLAGGYGPDNVSPQSVMDIFTPLVTCGTITPTATPIPGSATATPTLTTQPRKPEDIPDKL